MGLQCCMGGTTLQTLKLASIPSLSSSRFIFKLASKTPTVTLGLALSRHGRTQRPSLPLIVRALSAAPAIQTAPDEKGHSHFLIL